MQRVEEGLGVRDGDALGVNVNVARVLGRLNADRYKTPKPQRKPKKANSKN